MSTQNETGDDQSAKPCIVVPKIHSIGNINFDRFNIVGWTGSESEPYLCNGCKRQIRLSLSELLIFPKAKADTDLFQFVYTVPPHRTGGTFSVQICPGSGTMVVKDREYPSTVRVMGSGDASPDVKDKEIPGESPTPAAARSDDVDREEVRKKVQSMSPEKAEERYNHLLKIPISELTDSEYAERLALIDRLTEKPKRE